MPVKRPNGAKGKCDDLVSLIVRSEGSCMRCGWTCQCERAPKHHGVSCKLTTSHIIGRTYSATRTHLPNLQPLCYSCHRRFTDWPREFSHWITETIGSEAYDELKAMAETVTKMNWNDELERLKVIAKERNII